MENCVEGVLQTETFLHDRDQGVGSHGGPYLSFDGIGRGSKEALDAQMLFDPFEKQFNLPTLMINRRDNRRGDLKIVRKENESLVDVGGIKTDATQQCRDFKLRLTPSAVVRDYDDFYGNKVHYFDIADHHPKLIIEAISRVETVPTNQRPPVPRVWLTE